MPSQAALERGSAVAQGILDCHMQANGGAYPETVAVCVYPRPRTQQRALQSDSAGCQYNQSLPA